MGEWTTKYPVNFSPTGDTTSQAISKFINEFSEVYNFLNRVRKLDYGDTAPSDPVVGHLWLDTSSSPPVLKIWDGSNWVSNIKVEDAFKLAGFTASQSPSAGQIPVLRNDGRLSLPDITDAIYIGGSPWKYRVMYVDETNGDDSNSGSSSSPLKTIKEAINRFPPGGGGRIYLLSDVTINTNIDIYQKWVYIKGNNHTITALYGTGDYASTGYNSVAGFKLYHSSLTIESATISFSEDTTNPVNDSYSWDSYRAFVKRGPGGGFCLCSVAACTVNLPSVNANFGQTGAGDGAVFYILRSVTVNYNGVGKLLFGDFPPFVKKRYLTINNGSWKDIVTAYSGFNLGTSGYMLLPSGLLWQWGEDPPFSLASHDTVDHTINYPIAFPNAVLKVVVSKNIDSAGSAAYVSADVKQGTVTTSSFTIVYDNVSDISKTVGAYWLAIGY